MDWKNCRKISHGLAAGLHDTKKAPFGGSFIKRLFINISNANRLEMPFASTEWYQMRKERRETSNNAHQTCWFRQNLGHSRKSHVCTSIDKWSVFCFSLKPTTHIYTSIAYFEYIWNVLQHKCDELDKILKPKAWNLLPSFIVAYRKTVHRFFSFRSVPFRSISFRSVPLHFLHNKICLVYDNALFVYQNLYEFQWNQIMYIFKWIFSKWIMTSIKKKTSEYWRSK